MSRLLTSEEQKKVLKRIAEINEQKRQDKYGNILRGMNKTEQKQNQSVIDILKEIDGISDGRDAVDNEAYLRFVEETTNAEGMDLTEAQIDEIANGIQKMGTLEKVVLIAENSSEAREAGKVDLVGDIEKAAKIKTGTKADLQRKADAIKAGFEKEKAKADKKIAGMDKLIVDKEAEIVKRKDELAQLFAPKSILNKKGEITETELEKNADDEEQRNSKAEGIKKLIEEAKKELEKLIKRKEVLERKSSKLADEFLRIEGEIDKALTGKDISSKPKDLDIDVDDEITEGSDDEITYSYNGQNANTGKPKSKAESIIAGANTFLSKEDILQYLMEGRFDDLLKAKMELKLSSEGLLFDKTINQIIKDYRLGDTLPEITGRNFFEKSWNRIKRTGVRIMNVNKRIESMEIELGELLAINRNELTVDQENRLLYIQLEVLKSVQKHKIMNYLPFFGNRAMRQTDMAKRIATRISKRNERGNKNREFVKKYLKVRGNPDYIQDYENQHRMVSPKVAYYDGRDATYDVGNSSGR